MKKLKDDALYWTSIRSYKAYLISGHLLRHRSTAAAARALGISVVHLHKEIKTLRSYGLMQDDESQETDESQTSAGSTASSPDAGDKGDTP